MGVDLAREVHRWFRHRVELGDLRVYQVQVERRQVCLKPVQPARSDNCQCNAWAAPDPGQGDGGRDCANLVGHGAERVDDHMIPLARHARDCGAPGIDRTDAVAAKLARQEPVLERRPGHDAHAHLLRHRDQLTLGDPLQQGVIERHSVDRRQALEWATACACETFQAGRSEKPMQRTLPEATRSSNPRKVCSIGAVRSQRCSQ